MSKKKPKLPAATSQSGSFFLNGRQLGTTTRGKDGGYSTSISLDPNEQAALDSSNANTNRLLGIINGGFGSAERTGYTNDFFNPRKNVINREYDTQTERTAGRFNSSGGLNSVGFARFLANQIEKNRAQQLDSAYSEAQLNTENILNQQLASNQNVGSNILNRALGFAGNAFQGQQVGFNQDAQRLQLTPKGFF